MAINIFGIDDKLQALRKEKPVLGEIVKQLIDQPLHILMAVASVWAVGSVLFYLVVLSATLSVTIAGVATGLWMGVREYLQWPSSRWWDPPLDWFFEAGGLVLGVWWFFSTMC